MGKHRQIMARTQVEAVKILPKKGLRGVKLAKMASKISRKCGHKMLTFSSYWCNKLDFHYILACDVRVLQSTQADCRFGEYLVYLEIV